MNNYVYRDALRSWIDGLEWNNPFEVTLNIKQGIGPGQFLTQEIGDETIRQVLKRIDRKFYSTIQTRKGAFVQAIVVMEVGYSGRIHYHLMLDCPTELTEAEMKAVVSECWLSLDWGYGEIDVQSYRPGLVNYLTKWDTKPVFNECIKYHLWKLYQK